MIKRLELLGPSCLTNAADDEPLFVLRANDELAAGIVRDWANQYLASKLRRQGALSPKQQAKFDEALLLAEQMEQWRSASNQGGKP